jgi:hypothetical protein
MKGVLAKSMTGLWTATKAIVSLAAVAVAALLLVLFTQRPQDAGLLGMAAVFLFLSVLPWIKLNQPSRQVALTGVVLSFGLLFVAARPFVEPEKFPRSCGGQRAWCELENLLFSLGGPPLAALPFGLVGLGALVASLRALWKYRRTAATPVSSATPEDPRTQPMRPGPGQVASAPAVSARRLLILLAAALIPLWLWHTRYPPIHEYRLYFSESRQPGLLAWGELSHGWTESRVKEHFKAASVRCLPDESGHPGTKRVCSVDLHSLNGIPTMTVNFLFSEVGLQKVATNIPWWSHGQALDKLVKVHGAPDSSQDRRVAGVRLHAWKLANGAAIFYNRDREFNPLMTNSIQWTGPQTCGGSPCLH